MEQYAKLGYDRVATTEYIVQSAGSLMGPALDVGTGKGITAIALARLGIDVVSVDPDADEQDLARLFAAEKGLEDRIHFVYGDASSLSYPDNYFGCAILTDVLHHLDDPAPVLKETARLIKPSGVMLIADFSADGFELVSMVHRMEGREHPVSGATLNSAETFLTASGFITESRFSKFNHEVVVLKKNTDANSPIDQGV